MLVLQRDKEQLMNMFEANNLGHQVEEFKI